MITKNFLKNISRRHFIKYSGLTVLAGTVPTAISESNKSGALGKLICATPQSAKYIGGDSHKVEHNLFYVYNMDKKEHLEFEIPVGLAHSTLAHPKNRDLAVVIEKDGPYTCLVDFEKQKTLIKVTGSSGFLLTGHGIFSQDGSELFLGEYPADHSQPGQILVLNSDDLSVKRSFSSEGIVPYGMAWINKELLAVGHFGMPPEFEREERKNFVSLINVQSGKVIEKIEAPAEHIYIAHLEVSNNKLFALTHDTVRPRGGFFDHIREIKKSYTRWVTERPFFGDIKVENSPILVMDLKSQEKKFEISHQSPGAKWGLGLSLNHQTDIVAGAHGLGKTMTFQNASSGEIIFEHQFENESPRAVTVTNNKKYFVVTTDTGKLYYFNAANLQVEHIETPALGRYNFVVNATCV